MLVQQFMRQNVIVQDEVDTCSYLIVFLVRFDMPDRTRSVRETTKSQVHQPLGFGVFFSVLTGKFKYFF